VLAKRLALHIESLAPQGRIDCLDIGSGDLTLAEAVQQRLPRSRWSSVDVLSGFDGALPFEDGEFDAAVMCAVLHELPDEAAALLAEAARAARHVLVEVPKRLFSHESFAEIAAQEGLAITALDCGLDLRERSPGPGELARPRWQFIAVLARRRCKKQKVLSKV
jgi:SAM-dependent methyltransferase